MFFFVMFLLIMIDILENVKFGVNLFLRIMCMMSVVFEDSNGVLVFCVLIIRVCVYVENFLLFILSEV